MGLFDYVRCKLPLPGVTPDMEFQSKDTPAQYMEQYEVREDGSLWRVDTGERCTLTDCVEIYTYRKGQPDIELALFYVRGNLRIVVDRVSGDELPLPAQAMTR